LLSGLEGFLYKADVLIYSKRRSAIRYTQWSEVVPALVELVEMDLRLDLHTRSSISEVWVASRRNDESFTFWLPGKFDDSICSHHQIRH
jgi:hypothetical protein